jgi:hypothetical protein
VRALRCLIAQVAEGLAKNSYNSLRGIKDWRTGESNIAAHAGGHNHNDSHEGKIYITKERGFIQNASGLIFCFFPTNAFQRTNNRRRQRRTERPARAEQGQAEGFLLHPQPLRWGWHFSPRYFAVTKHIQLLTARMVHVTNLTHPGVTTLLYGNIEDVFNRPVYSSPEAGVVRYHVSTHNLTHAHI